MYSGAKQGVTGQTSEVLFVKYMILLMVVSGAFCGAQESRTLYLPHFTTKGNDWSTELAFSNSDGLPRTLQVFAFDENGTPAGNWSHDLPPNGGLYGSLQDVCPGLEAETGGLALVTDSETLSGLMKFIFLSTGGSSSLPLVENPSRNWVMPLLENSSDWTSGTAFFNTSDQANGIKLTLKSVDGITIQSVYQELQAHGKWVAMLTDLFESPIPQVTFLEVESAEPVTCFALTFAPGNHQIVAVPATETTVPVLSEEDQLLNKSFRIDIQDITAALDFYPLEGIMRGQATLDFYMLPGQSQALVHFSEHILNNRVESVILDGETLDILNEQDIQIVEFSGSAQRGLEFQRDLEPFKEHQLVIRFFKNFTIGSQAFFSDVNDITGYGNEFFFPTINRPAELARHKISFNIHDDQPYYFIGSGLVQEQSLADGQSWLLDTERQIASYTIMFFLATQDVVSLNQRTINGTEVRILTERSQAYLANEAFSILGSWLPKLEREIGPFPMQRGLSLFISSSGGGMEYFGGSITSNWALQHEVFHMYFACSTVAKTYRDSWWDEAITSWYESGPNAFPALSEAYTSSMVGGRSPISRGFDTAAYNQGAGMFEHISQHLGGREELVSFLSYLWSTYQWSPFTTQDLLQVLSRKTGLDYFNQFDQWLYTETKENQPVSILKNHQVQIPQLLTQPRQPSK